MICTGCHREVGYFPARQVDGKSEPALIKCPRQGGAVAQAIPKELA